MKPKGLSVLSAFIVLVLSALFSSWLIIEILFLFIVISFARRGVIWPKSDIPENPIWFGLFWGLIIGILCNSIWLKIGLTHVLPSLLDQV